MKSLTREELNRLLEVAGSDELMFRVMFNHGLRVSEIVGGWDRIDGKLVRREPLGESNIVDGHLVMQRSKRSRKTTQPLLPDEMVLTTMKGAFFQMSRVTVWRKMQRYGRAAGISQFLAHPHALRHSAGRLGYLGGMGVPEIQRYLGHVNGGNTLIYLEASEREAAAAFAAACGESGC
jgi:integrase